MELYGGCGEPLASLVGAGSLVVDPPMAVLPRLLDRIESTAPPEHVHVALSPGVADALSEAFLLESRVAGAVERAHLRVRRTTDRCDDRAVLAADRAGVLVGVDGEVEVLPVESEPLVESLHRTYDPVWEAAEPLSTRAPPRERLLAVGREQLSDAFTAQLERALDHASTLAWHGSPTPVELAAVVAARTGTEHYDLCAWAEQTEFTSRSTVARTKQAFEEAGVLDVEPVPQERGRPRQRLLVDDERVAAADAEDLVPTLRRVTT